MKNYIIFFFLFIFFNPIFLHAEVKPFCLQNFWSNANYLDIEKLLENKNDVFEHCTKETSSYYPIFVAFISMKDPKILKVFEKNNVDLFFKETNKNKRRGQTYETGITLLHFAARNNSLPSNIQYLIDKGIPVNARTTKDKIKPEYGGITPLHLACSYSNVENIKILIANNADLQAKDDIGEDCFYKALSNDNSDVIPFLIQIGAKADISTCKDCLPVITKYLKIKYDGSLREWVSPQNHILKMLIREGYNLNELKNCNNISYITECNLTPIQSIFYNFEMSWSRMEKLIPDYKELIITLIKNHANLRATRHYFYGPPIMQALKLREDSDKELFHFLVLNGASLNVENYSGATPLMIAINKNFELADKFLYLGADANYRNKNGESTFMQFVASDNLNAAKYLLKVGADINARDNKGNTAFHHAAKSSNLETIQFMFEIKANPHVLNQDGENILHSAAVYSFNSKVIKAIINNSNVDINLLSKKYEYFGRELLDGGVSPLMLALNHNHSETVIKTLIEHGADVNLKTKGGLTPLMFAIHYSEDYARKNEWSNCVTRSEKNAIARVRTLIKNGASINEVSNYGHTALHGISEHGRYTNFDDIIILDLIQNGANTKIKNKEGKTAFDLIKENICLNKEDLFFLPVEKTKKAYWKLHDLQFN